MGEVCLDSLTWYRKHWELKKKSGQKHLTGN